MKKFLHTIAVVLLLAAVNAFAAPTYQFTATTGTAVDMTGATSLGWGAWTDDVSSSVMNIGFTFTFGGINYTQFSVNSNGCIGLGSSAVTAAYVNDNFPASSPYSWENTTHPIIAPFFEDLQISPSAGAGVRYKLVGSAPNRVLVVEWDEMMWNRSTSVIYTFQGRLYEGSNRIEFLYIAMPTSQATDATIGLATSATEFLTITPGSPATASTTTANNYVDVASTAIAANTMYVLAACPSAGLPYFFTPMTGTATDMSGATSLGWEAWTDDESSSVMNIGFTFTFSGTDYTQFSVNSNGCIGLGSSAVTAAYVNDYFPASRPYSWENTTHPIIAPFWEDLQVSPSAGAGVRYKLVGSSPNRVLVVEWDEMMWNRSTSVIYTFQGRLYEGSNRIEFIYIAMPTSQGTSATIGMASSATSYMTVTPGVLTTVSGTTANNYVNVSSTAIASGTMYAFDPTAILTSTPLNVTVCAGSPASFTVGATGPGLHYQWYHGGSVIPGATGSTHTIASATASDAGTYSCLVSGVCLSTTTTAATLTVHALPAITADPTSLTICTTHDATFSVTATGTGITYQWQKNSVDLADGGGISGVNTATLSIDNATTADNGLYRCVVTGTCAPAATSAAATLVVHAPPTIAVSVSPDLLWPPNHWMRTIAATVTTTGNCTPLTIELVSLESNEPDDANGNGDGNTTDDIQNESIGTADYSFDVRAERAGSGRGRTYTATYRVTDNAGNTATATATVFVPKDMDLPKPAATGIPSLALILEQNAPNPFGAQTEIRFWSADPASVQLKIYAIDGTEVATLLDGPVGSGVGSVNWDGRGRDGRMLPSGTYLCRLTANGTVQQLPLVIAR